MGKQLSEFHTSTEIIEYCRAKAIGHNSYKKYDDYNIINIDNHHLFLTDGTVSHWDDLIDQESVSNNPKKIYVTSFCCQTDENVAMWKLYGRYMLNIKKRQMHELNNNIEKIELLYSFNDERDVIELCENCYDLKLVDVIYHGAPINGIVNLTHQEEHVSILKEEFNKLKKAYKYVLKNHAYYNERECRLVLTIKENKTEYLNYHIARITYKPEFIKKEDIYVSPGNWNGEKGCNHSKLEKLVDLKGYFK